MDLASIEGCCKNAFVCFDVNKNTNQVHPSEFFSRIILLINKFDSLNEFIYMQCNIRFGIFSSKDHSWKNTINISCFCRLQKYFHNAMTIIGSGLISF